MTREILAEIVAYVLGVAWLVLLVYLVWIWMTATPPEREILPKITAAVLIGLAFFVLVVLFGPSL